MTNRKVFLKTTTAAIAASAGASLLGSAADATPVIFAPILSDRRAYVAGKYGLEIDGAMAGWLHTAEGPGIGAALALGRGTEPTHSPPAQPPAGPIAISCGTGMSREFYNWLKSSFAGGGRKNGAIIGTNYNNQEVFRIEFQNALLTDITLPALDAASKDAAKMSLKLEPETTRWGKTNPTKIVGGTLNSTVQKMWTPANFRLKIAGLEDACNRVNKIDAIKVGSPNFSITFPASHAQGFEQWAKQPGSKPGSLAYLAPNLSQILFLIDFGSLQLSRLETESAPKGMESIQKVKATLSYGGLTLAQTPA